MSGDFTVLCIAPIPHSRIIFFPNSSTQILHKACVHTYLINRISLYFVHPISSDISPSSCLRPHDPFLNHPHRSQISHQWNLQQWTPARSQHRSMSMVDSVPRMEVRALSVTPSSMCSHRAGRTYSLPMPRLFKVKVRMLDRMVGMGL